MIEKFNKNAKVEKFTNMLIVGDSCPPNRYRPFVDTRDSHAPNIY